MTDQLTDDKVRALLEGATENAYYLEVVKWGGGIRCVYLNDYRVAGEKPWGGGDTTRRFKVRMADIMQAFRGTVQAAAPDLARALLDARADAQAAVTLAYKTAAKWVEKRAEDYDREFGIYDHSTGVTEYPGTGYESMEEWETIAAGLRALAPADGLAAVEALRKERDRFEAALGRACQVGGTTYLVERAEKSEAERDRLAAANAVLDAKVAGLRDFIDDFAKAKIDALRYSPPCGSSPEDEPDPVVDAKTVWAWQADAKAALATQEAGTC